MSPESNEDRCTATNREGERCGAWAMNGAEKCYHHRGTSPDGSSHKENANAVSHGLHQTPETFLSNAEERHRDTYHAVFEALCARFEAMHSREPDYANKQELKHVALDLVKQDLGTEYMRERAIDTEKPLTESQVRDIGGDAMEVEAVSKAAQLVTNLKRENRLRMKEMGLYFDPETKKADAAGDLAAVIEGINAE